MAKELPHLAKALKRARTAAGLSQNQLAKMAGVSRPTIATLEIGLHQNAQADTLKKLAHALKISTSELLGGGTKGEEKAFDELLASGFAGALNISAQERAWLKALRHEWPAGRLTPKALFLLLEALRASDHESE